MKKIIFSYQNNWWLKNDRIELINIKKLIQIPRPKRYESHQPGENLISFEIWLSKYWIGFTSFPKEGFFIIHWVNYVKKDYKVASSENRMNWSLSTGFFT